MAEATTTRPARTRKAAAPKAAAKAAPAKAAPAPAPADDEANAEKYVVEFEFVADTKSYAKWQPKAGNGCVGTMYVPIGTKRVRMLIIGPAAE